jgi:hypothetical protein
VLVEQQEAGLQSAVVISILCPNVVHNSFHLLVYVHLQAHELHVNRH